MLPLKMKKIGLIGAEKRGETLAGHELGKNFFKEDVWGNIMPRKDDVLMDDSCYVDKKRQGLLKI